MATTAKDEALLKAADLTAKQLQQAIEIVEGRVGNDRAQTDGGASRRGPRGARYQLPSRDSVNTANYKSAASDRLNAGGEAARLYYAPAVGQMDEASGARRRERHDRSRLATAAGAAGAGLPLSDQGTREDRGVLACVAQLDRRRFRSGRP